MATSTPAITGLRLPPQAGEQIDRGSTFQFTFDGRPCTAHPGDTLASALLANGNSVLSRSFKYHRPRGVLCCTGNCPNCLVQVGDEPNVRACMHPATPGLQVTHQNAWPSLDTDLMAATQIVDQFLPVGFYYKTFIRPKVLWPLYEKILRTAAGLGKVLLGSRPGKHHKQYVHVDVAVIGGGPAGMRAALAAAAHGAQVMLLDEQPALGGHLRFTDANSAATLAAQVAAQPRISVHTNTAVVGWYEGNWLAATCGNELLKIRMRAVVNATGAVETPLVFGNNDLPGIMLGVAAQRLLKLFAVRPGQRALVVTANDSGWQVAADLHAAGIRLAAIVDQRSATECQSEQQAALSAVAPVYWEHTITGAMGDRRVHEAVIAPLSATGAVDAGAGKFVDCDLVTLSVGWTPQNGLLQQMGGRVQFDAARCETLPVHLPAGVFAAGRVAGTHSLAAELREGQQAGDQAAAHLGLCAAPAPLQLPAAQRQSSAHTLVNGSGKNIVCLCEDVTKQDVLTAIEEGFDSAELLKRYSTTAMGPCQGLMCAHNVKQTCAGALRQPAARVGGTTARPPARPMALGVLGGQHLEPVQYSPLQAWHAAHGAKMMLAGLWVRAERYGDPHAEVRAVRERVGLIDVSSLGKIELTGPGVPALLERVYVNNWGKLASGRVRYGLMCNDEGVVLDDGVTAHLSADTWYMTTTTSGASAIYEWLQWWAQSGWGAGVLLANRSEDFAAFNLAGPHARSVLQKLVPDCALDNAAFPYMHVRTATLSGVPCRILRIGFTGELSYEVHCPSGSALAVWEALMAAGSEFGIAPFGVEAQRILRLEKGHIIVGQDTEATTDPISADLAALVKLDKADFLGKRSLARIATHGAKQRLVGFKPVARNVVPEEGLQIVRTRGAGGARPEIIGWVTSCKFSPTLGETIGLCWLPTELADQAGAEFTIWRNDKGLQARVHHGAFYDAAGARLQQ